MTQSGLFTSAQVDPIGENGLGPARRKCLLCVKCDLAPTRKNVVFGEGNANAPDILFLGEAPGGVDDELGRPFVGPAGKMLERQFTRMGYSREQLYFCNAVACRPPDNRAPEKVEIEACYEYVVAQIRAVRPKVIVALGATAFASLFRGKKKISEVRGKWFLWEEIPVLPTFHPSYLLRIERKPEGPEQLKLVWGDLLLVLQKLGREAPARQTDHVVHQLTTEEPVLE